MHVHVHISPFFLFCSLTGYKNYLKKFWQNFGLGKVSWWMNTSWCVLLHGVAESDITERLTFSLLDTHIADSFCHTAESNTTLWSNYTPKLFKKKWLEITIPVPIPTETLEKDLQKGFASVLENSKLRPKFCSSFVEQLKKVGLKSRCEHTMACEPNLAHNLFFVACWLVIVKNFFYISQVLRKQNMKNPQ